MATNGDKMRERAENAGIPLRTLCDVKAALAKAGTAAPSMARLMLNHGRLTNEARDHLLALKD